MIFAREHFATTTGAKEAMETDETGKEVKKAKLGRARR